MRYKEFILYINVAGAVSSILALLLTLAQNDTFAFVLKLLVAIAFFIAASGTFGLLAYKLRKWTTIKPQWPFDALFWLIMGTAIAFLSLLIACLGYFLVDSFIYMFSAFINDIKTDVL